jgi:hypothetical protein
MKKRAALAVLGIVIGYLEFRADLNYWLPAVGSLDSGYALTQVIVFAILAAILFGTAISLSYRFLNSILD